VEHSISVEDVEETIVHHDRKLHFDDAIGCEQPLGDSPPSMYVFAERTHSVELATGNREQVQVFSRLFSHENPPEGVIIIAPNGLAAQEANDSRVFGSIKNSGHPNGAAVPNR
jgi:hypothetical protein